MPEVTVGPPADDAELEALAVQRTRTYNQTSDEAAAWIEQRRENLQDVRVVRSGGQVAGGLGLIPMGQWFGGRSVPMTGIGGVGIDPRHRAGGLASVLMRSVLEELHANGCALSALYPATVPVYRRVGYELAGRYDSAKIATNVIDVRDRELPVELVEDPAQERFQPLYEARARMTSGNLDRSAWYWNAILHPPKSTLHAYTFGDEGYVLFTQPSSTGWGYDIAVRDAVALTPRAARRMWTFFADHRSFAPTVKWNGTGADPMFYVLREQEWDVTSSWTWMLRVVDVERALTERGYSPLIDTDISLRVRDDLLPGNDANFTLHVSGGKGEVTRNGDGRVQVDIRGFAPLYTGFLPAEALKTAGLIDGPDEALGRLSAIFAGPAPWLADFF